MQIPTPTLCGTFWRWGLVICLFPHGPQLDTEVENHRSSRNLSVELARPGPFAHEAYQDVTAMRPPEIHVPDLPPLPGHLTTCPLRQVEDELDERCGSVLVSASISSTPDIRVLPVMC